LNRSLKVDPREPLNYFYLGELLAQEENFRDAVGAFLRAHQLSPLWADPLRRLGTVYSRLNRLGDAHYTLGQTYLVQDEDEKAIMEMTRAVKIFGETSPRGQVIQEELAAIRARK
jgi:beta-barrel assembly-enhancing protease